MNKPTDPHISITCDRCEGGGYEYSLHDDFAEDVCCKCEGTRRLPVFFDDETCSLGFYIDASFSTYGYPDHEPEALRQLSYCYDAWDYNALTAWFVDNAVYIASQTPQALTTLQDPEIKCTCYVCLGLKSIKSTAGKFEKCWYCDGVGGLNMAFNPVLGMLMLSTETYSVWGEVDGFEAKTAMFGACADEQDTLRMHKWFSLNSAFCEGFIK